ncbi:unnamed protein product, partial [Rotaria sp. Silwood1]
MVGERDCICCGKRLGKNDKRPVINNRLWIFISARLFPSPIPVGCFICATCRWMFKNWSAEPYVKEILLKIDDPSKYIDVTHEECDESKNGNVSHDKYDNEMMDGKESDQGSSNEKDDNEMIDENECDESSSNGSYDNEMENDIECNGNDSINSNLVSDDNNLLVRNESISAVHGSLKLPIGIAIASKSQCCVCRIPLVSPTITVKKEDRNNILIRRNIYIPKGSRCCKDHTSNGYLSREAFFKLAAYKINYRIFDSNYIIDTMKKLRTMVNCQKRIDFDDPSSLSDADNKILTGFTQPQHNRVLECIPSTALKNSVNRSPRCALACLVMKLRLGISNAALASMLGIDNKRKVSDIIHSTRLAL